MFGFKYQGALNSMPENEVFLRFYSNKKARAYLDHQKFRDIATSFSYLKSRNSIDQMILGIDIDQAVD